jgi:hypothetical protein
MAVGGVADVRSLAVNEEGLKVVATNGYKKTVGAWLARDWGDAVYRQSCGGDTDAIASKLGSYRP